jgi:hypothetical protein
MLTRPTTPLPETPAMLRARIAVRLEFLRQCHPDSAEYWRLQRDLADLERRLYALEEPFRPKPVRKDVDLGGQPF